MPALLTISLQTALSFPPLSVTTKGRPYIRRDISDAVFTLSIAFCSKSIQKRVRYLFPAGTLPPSFSLSCKRKKKDTDSHQYLRIRSALFYLHCNHPRPPFQHNFIAPLSIHRFILGTCTGSYLKNVALPSYPLISYRNTLSTSKADIKIEAS